MSENKAFDKVYDQIYSMLCFSPEGEDPSKTNRIIQLGINIPIDPKDYDGMISPNNPGGNLQKSIAFAMLVDQIPYVGKSGGSTGANLARVYADIINNANVADKATEAQVNRYNDAWKVLFATFDTVDNPEYDKTDPTSPKEITKIKPTPLYEGYMTAKTAYDNAVSNYFSKYDSEASKTIAGQGTLRKLQKKIDDAYRMLELAGRAKVEEALNDMTTAMNKGLSSLIANSQRLLKGTAFIKDLSGVNWGIDYPIPSSWSAQTASDKSAAEIDTYLRNIGAEKKKLGDNIAAAIIDLQNATAAGKNIDACQDKLDKLNDKLSDLNDKIRDKLESIAEKYEDKIDAQSPLYSDFEFTTSSYKEHKHADGNIFSAGVGLSLGLFSLGAVVSGDTSHKSADEETSDVKITGQIATLQISRPWFDPTIFSLPGWTNSTYGKNKISSGDPTDKDAVLPMYTTALVLAKNLSIESAFSSLHSEDKTFTIDVDAQIGFGPFRFGPKFKHTQSDYKCEKTANGYKITNLGVQIIGYINAVVPACPQEDDPQIAKK